MDANFRFNLQLLLKISHLDISKYLTKKIGVGNKKNISYLCTRNFQKDVLKNVMSSAVETSLHLRIGNEGHPSARIERQFADAIILVATLCAYTYIHR